MYVIVRQSADCFYFVKLLNFIIIIVVHFVVIIAIYTCSMLVLLWLL